MVRNIWRAYGEFTPVFLYLEVKILSFAIFKYPNRAHILLQTNLCWVKNMTKRPLDILDQVLNRQPVIVSLKGGRELRGVLQGYDVHMNLVLDKAEEMENDVVKSVGTLIVRGDNVIYISPSME